MYQGELASFYLFAVDVETLTVVDLYGSVDEISQRSRQHDLCCSARQHSIGEEIDANNVAILQCGNWHDVNSDVVFEKMGI